MKRCLTAAILSALMMTPLQAHAGTRQIVYLTGEAPFPDVSEAMARETSAAMGYFYVTPSRSRFTLTFVDAVLPLGEKISIHVAGRNLCVTVGSPQTISHVEAGREYVVRLGYGLDPRCMVPTVGVVTVVT